MQSRGHQLDCSTQLFVWRKFLLWDSTYREKTREQRSSVQKTLSCRKQRVILKQRKNSLTCIAYIISSLWQVYTAFLNPQETRPSCPTLTERMVLGFKHWPVEWGELHSIHRLATDVGLSPAPTEVKLMVHFHWFQWEPYWTTTLCPWVVSKVFQIGHPKSEATFENVDFNLSATQYFFL